MLAKKARVWFFTAPATLPLLKRTMLKKTCFSHCSATTANCNAWVRSICHFDVGKNNWREFSSILHLPHYHFRNNTIKIATLGPFFLLLGKIGESFVPLHLPCCYFLRGCWKTCFRPLFCNNCWKGETLQCLGHKCFFLKVAMLLTHVGKKIGESLVPYFTCHTATFEGDAEKHVFSHCFATTAERKKMLWHSYSVTPFCNNCWKEKNAVTLLQPHPHFATTAERKKMLWHSYSVTPTELNGHDLCFKHTTAFSAGTTFSVGVMAIQFKSHHHIPKNLTRGKNGSRLPFGSCAHFGASTFQWPTHSSLLSNFDFCGLAGQWQPGRLDRSVWNRFA